jgi:HEAT repeat protein
MNNPQIAHHIARLKHENHDVRNSAAEALGEIGDATAVPALVEALKDGAYSVRKSVARALGKIGNSVTLPRKVLASSQLSAQNKIDVLEAVRRIQYQEKHLTLQYIFPDTRTLCETVLNEEDAQARQGARTLLNWLDG